MKKITFCMMAACILLSFAPTQLKAENEKSASTARTAKTVESMDAVQAAEIAETADANAGIARLEEIRAMDMSSLTPAEKKELREEVHMIQDNQGRHDRDRNRYDNDGPRHHHRHGGIVFVGGGGLLLIILILLLL